MSRGFNNIINGYREEIPFTYEGVDYVFMTEPNDMNDNQMWWFNPQVTMYAGTTNEAKAIARNIKKRK